MKIKSIFGLLILILLCSSCSRKKGALTPPPSYVETLWSVSKDIPYYIDTIGHFAALNTVTIQAQVQGELTGLYFCEGQRVKKGDLLFTIDPDPYQAVLDKAVATLRQNEALYAYNKNRVERYRDLVQVDYVSKLEYEQFISEMKNYAALIEENLAQIDSAEINVGYCTLYSPIEGVTGKKLVDVGNVITDVGTKMLVVNQISPIYIDFSIPERFFDIVYQKQQECPLSVQLEVPNTSLRATATLQMLDNAVNPNTGMIALRGILGNEDYRFWPQQFVRVRLIVDTIKEAVMVPPEAVLPSSEGEIVWFVNEKEEADYVRVKTGEQYQDKIQITEGLNEGVQVITKGQLGLVKGKKVIVKNKQGEQG